MRNKPQKPLEEKNKKANKKTEVTRTWTAVGLSRHCFYGTLRFEFLKVKLYNSNLFLQNSLDIFLLVNIIDIMIVWPGSQAVKTPPFHGGDTGSIPVRVTIE